MEPLLVRPNVDDTSAYREALRRAEEGAVTTDASGEEVPGETPVVTPELEGAVPIAASDQPLEPEPAVTPPVVAADTSEQQPEAPAVVEPLTVEQLQVKLADAEARLAEKDSFIGRQSGEVGELRRVVDELSARVDQAQAQPVAPVQAPVAITQELIDSDPQRATLLAFEQKDDQSLRRAYDEWKEVDPFTAGQWLTDQRLEQQQAAFDAKLEEMQQQFQTTTAPLAKAQEQEQDQAAWNEVFVEAEQQRPGLIQEAARLLEGIEANPAHPLLPALQSKDQKIRVAALTSLYDFDKLGNPEHLRQAAEQAAVEAAATRAAAGAVSGQNAAGQAAVEQTVEEEEAEKYKARMGTRPSLSKGWTGRKSS